MSDTTDDEILPKQYAPSSVEQRWYEFWESNGFFVASGDENDPRPTYTIAIPPPNVTGTLHMGHACRTTFEDVLTRYHRMRGYDALWIPGTDHAGIATQVVVERILARENTTRHELGREKFVERVWEWKKTSGDRIYEQLRKMGSSCDWSRVKFTMDPDLAHAVREAFVRLYEEGLIYRGTRLVNWDVVTQTVLSDLEVETQENVEGELFEFAYAVVDADGNAKGEVVVATTRPETMLGDTALAVHPDDERYTHLHGCFGKHPFVDRLVPIIADAELVDMKFGTGVVKVTPAHDPNDFATGKRHGLEEINIFHLDGTLNAEGGPFEGLERFVARKRVKEKLDELGLARGSKKHMMTLPRSQRSGSVVEPMISTQWFVNMEPLAKPAIEAVENGTIQILPEDWSKTYFHWLRNIQDWCISRQLWWGHPIPAFYCEDCEHVNVTREDPSACAKCGSTKLRADEDVLDTWFSSALWPFSTLGWPNDTPDLRRYYPTQDMETGYDILFFWVARMIMMGLHFMGEVPFKRVLLAGLVTDERGEKMSKVKGNVIDPLDVIGGATLDQLVAKAEFNGAKPSGLGYIQKTYPDGFAEYGTDALRMTLLSYSPQSRRIALSLKRVEGYRNFANKLWNAARYALPKVEGAVATGEAPQAKALANRWVLSRLANALEAAGAGIDAYRLDEASGALYRFVWDELCDWYLELSKPLLDSDDAELVAETKAVLVHVLETTLRALHPMMPFVTEEIWHRVPKSDALGVHPRDAAKPRSLMMARYPLADADARRDEAAERDLAVVQELVGSARSIRAEHDLPRARTIEIHYVAEPAAADVLAREARLIATLSNATLHVTDAAKLDDPHTHFPNAAVFAAPGVKGVVPDVIDPAKERERLQRELKKLTKELDVLTKKLANASFVDRAPAEVVEKARQDSTDLAAQKTQLEGALARLGG
ncbi:MAG: valine--tRNA ligase [Sandaracinus sp.]|nr:valine--tRNA ligase [Sandaracinus sp.]MCB9623875.1 valine--tRNA ligase [Sandaracinus sp.]